MICYKCDGCKAIVGENSVYEFERFPRVIRRYYTDAAGAKLQPYDEIGEAETHLCEYCYNALAHAMLPFEKDV